MNDSKKYGATRYIAHEALTHRSAAADWYPSRVLRDYEAELIVELARQTALDGRRFVGWPTIIMDSERDYGYLGRVILRAEVATVPHA